MKFVFALVSCLLPLALANDGPAGCHADNCARDVTGTRFGTARITQARADCTSQLLATPAAQHIPSYIANCPNFAGYSSACSCWGINPTPVPCNGANLLTDNNNCGTCNNKCGPGSTCTNGVCSVPTCQGLTCSTFVNCSPGGTNDCQCYSTADGTGFCAHNQLCAGLADCTTNSDCGAGSICAVNSCCTRNVCLPAVCGNPSTRLTRLAKKKLGDGCNSGNPCA